MLLVVDGLLSLEPWSPREPRIYPSPLESLYLEASGRQPAGNEAKLVLPKKMPIWKMTFHVCACLSRETCQNVLCWVTNEVWAFITAISDYLCVAVSIHSTLQCSEKTETEDYVSVLKGHPALADGENGDHWNWMDWHKPRLSERQGRMSWEREQKWIYQVLLCVQNLTDMISFNLLNNSRIRDFYLHFKWGLKSRLDALSLPHFLNSFQLCGRWGHTVDIYQLGDDCRRQ